MNENVRNHYQNCVHLYTEKHTFIMQIYFSIIETQNLKQKTCICDSMLLLQPQEAYKIYM